MSLDGKVALVTGGSRGIGHFIALELARAGADVVVAARSEREPDPRLPGTIHSVADEIRALGRRALAVRMDVTNDEEIERGLGRAIDEMGQIDIVVNNAGIMPLARFADEPLRRWDLVLRVNLRGAVAVTKAVLPHMIKRRTGTIIFISSGVADGAGAGNISYAVSKVALRKVAEGLADEMREYGIAAFALSPAALVVTPGYTFVRGDEPPPSGVPVEPPEQMGRAAVALCSDACRPLSGRSFRSDEVLRDYPIA